MFLHTTPTTNDHIELQLTPCAVIAPTMDDEAASQQLMSEARATAHTDSYEGPAIPLNLAGATQRTTKATPDSGKKKKAKRLGMMQASQRNAFRDPSLATYSLEELQAFIGTSPSKSRTFSSTIPSTQIEVPDTQTESQGNLVPSSASIATKQVVSPDLWNRQPKRSKKSKKNVQSEVGQDNSNTVPATPYDEVNGEAIPSPVEATKSRGNQKRHRKTKLRPSTDSVNHDSTQVSETPISTQEERSVAQAEDTDMQNGVWSTEEQPLTPRDLLGKLNAERSQKSQSAGRVSPPGDKSADAISQLHAAAEQSELEATTGTFKTPETSARKRKRTKKTRDITESSTLEQKAPVESSDVIPSQPAATQDSDGEGASSWEAQSTNGRTPARYCIGGVTRNPRISRADPNRDYYRVRDDDDRTAADTALEKTHELGHPPDKRTNGEYTADEKELLRRAIRDYQERNGLDTADLVEIIHWAPRRDKGTNDHQTEAQFQADCDAFWEEIKNAGLLRTQKELRKHIRATYHTCQRGRWSQEEDEQLRDLSNLHPGQWKLIATQLNRLEIDTYNRWKDYVRHGPNRLTKKWTLDEEKNLVRVLNLVCQRVEDSRAESGKPPLDDYYHVINWHQVCRELDDSRSRLQCQSKWRIMRDRQPPATLDIEIKPRQTPPSNRFPLGPDDMLWGDKFDLVAGLLEQTNANESTSNDEIAWRDIKKRTSNKWSVQTLKTAFKRLCALVLDPEDDGDLGSRLQKLLNYMKENHENELEDQYHTAHDSEAQNVDEVGVEPSKKRKRKRKSDDSSGKETAKKRSKNTSSTAKAFKSKEIITDSESEL